MATAFNFTNGVHDAADAVATLVASRTAMPGPALAVAAFFTLLGPLLLGAAVADTIGKVVDVPQDQVVAVIGAGVSGALVWNLFSWWRGLPSSSTHASIGGLVGAAVVADGLDAVGWRTVALVGAALVISPALGFVTGFIGLRAARLTLRRAPREVRRPIAWGQWVQLGGTGVRSWRERRGQGDRCDRRHARGHPALDRYQRTVLGHRARHDLVHRRDVRRWLADRAHGRDGDLPAATGATGWSARPAPRSSSSARPRSARR